MENIEFRSALGKFEFNHWHFHFPVPEEVALRLMDEHHKRVLVWINGFGPYQMALMKAKETWYILINQELRKKHQLEIEKPVVLKMSRDQSEFGHEVPEEFQSLLDQDEKGNIFFRNLTPGKQRSLVYLVTKVKNPESRIRKSLAILHHLKVSSGKLDFKQLNEWIKHYNNL